MPTAKVQSSSGTDRTRSVGWILALCAVSTIACSKTPYPEVPARLGPSAATVPAHPPDRPPRALRISVASMQSPGDTYKTYSRVFTLLGTRLGGDTVDFVQRRTYAEVNELLAAGSLDAALICTGGYLDLERTSPGAVEVLAVPVIGGRTTYSSLVLVPAGSRAQSFRDLKGARFAFTDELSMSGHIYVARMLADMGTDERAYFANVTFTRSHDRSIDAVARGLFDGAAVDSLVFEQLLRERPSLATAVRVVHRSPEFGVSPLVASTRLAPERRMAIRQALLSLDADPDGADALREAGIDRFVEAPAGLYAGAQRLVPANAAR